MRSAPSITLIDACSTSSVTFVLRNALRCAGVSGVISPICARMARNCSMSASGDRVVVALLLESLDIFVLLRTGQGRRETTALVHSAGDHTGWRRRQRAGASG